jgi:hypothetical protein
LDENPVVILGEEGTLDGEYSDVHHPKTPPTAQACLYRLPREVKNYSFVSWDPDNETYGAYGVSVEYREDAWQIAILNEIDMDIHETNTYDELHDMTVDELQSYGEDRASIYASLIVDFL